MSVLSAQAAAYAAARDADQADAEGLGFFERYPAASFTVDGQTIAFGVEDIDEGFENDAPEHGRLYTVGRKVDKTGGGARRWTVRSLFSNGGYEPDVPSEQYPHALNTLLDLVRVQKTGDLVLPTRGPIRAVCKSYSRRETHNERDAAGVTLTFVEDSEDTSERSNWSPRSPTTAIASETGNALANADGEGFGIGDLSNAIQEYADLIDAFANVGEDPTLLFGQALDPVQGFASAVEELTRTVLDSVGYHRRNPGPTSGRGVLRPPGAETHATTRQFARLLDHAQTLLGRANARVAAERRPKVYRVDVSLFTVAAQERVDLAKLIALNPGVDPFRVPAGRVLTLPRDRS